MGIVGRPVQRINNPRIIAVHLVAAALLRKNGMVWEAGADQVEDDGFSGKVGLGDQVTIPLEGRIAPGRVTLGDHLTGSPGRLNSSL